MATIATNTFNGGLVLGSLDSLANPATYSYARNMVRSTGIKKGFGLTNEGSSVAIGNTSDVVGALYVEERDKIVYLREGDRITLFDPRTLEDEEVMTASEFGCEFNLGGCEWHSDIEAKTMTANCNDLYIYFSSKCEYYRINIDQMLDPARKAGLKKELECENAGCNSDKCEYFKVFKKSCTFKINAYSYQTGGSVKAGAYYFQGRLLNSDGGHTNWFHISDPVYVGSEHNIGGEDSNGHIEVKLSALDCKFSKIELAVIERIGGSVTAKSLVTTHFNNGNFSYEYYGDQGVPVDIEELLTKDTTYLRGNGLKQHNSRMYYYGLRQRKQFNFQPFANNIKVEWFLAEVPFAIAKKYNLKSFMGGEVYSFAIALNAIDGMHTYGFHIPCGGGGAEAEEGSSERTSSEGDSSSPGELPDVTVDQEQEVVRDRNPKDDSVSDPQDEDYTDLLDTLIASYDTEIEDVCDSITNCESCAGGGTQCTADKDAVEEIASDWMDTLASYGVDDLTVDFTPTTLRDSAKKIIEAIKNRERKSRKKAEYTLDNSSTDYTSSGETVNYLVTNPDGSTSAGSDFAGGTFDSDGLAEIEASIRILDSGETECVEEEDILYPCITDCDGEFVYRDLANTNVRNHRFPDRSDVELFSSKSVGVPSVLTPDADEYADGYVYLLGVKFSEIELPTDEEFGTPICRTNPYTILQVKRTEANKRILLKGLAPGAFSGTNRGKEYHYPRNGLNAKETINRYVDEAGSRIATGGVADSFTIFSLDGLIRKPKINAQKIKMERLMRGIGFRHGLYAKGPEPADTIKGARKDRLGARQAINLSKSQALSFPEADLKWKIYAPANEVVSPPEGGEVPLMNKYQQECIWVGADIPTHTDDSWVGDVLNHSAPIDLAQAPYVSLRRDMANQYGDLTNMAYIPIMQAGSNNSTSIRGLCGDVYVGPYSFVKTSYISDKVGSCEDAEKFDIPAQVDSKTEKRCICDGPEDVIHQANGMEVWTTLPEDGDAADPKNWAGTHSPNNAQTRTWTEAKAIGQAETDYYYPKTVTTLITYWGEFETNPWLREKSDLLENQWYPQFMSEFELDSGSSLDADTTWEDKFLNQFHGEQVQPSLWKRVLKGFLRTTLNVLFPMLGVDNFFDIASGGDFVGNLAEFPVLLALWWMITKLLLTNDFIDKLLNIPICKPDNVGGPGDGLIKGFFRNYDRYNWDYSAQNDIYTYQGLPDMFFTCDCDDCVNGETVDFVAYSDEQNFKSLLDSYTHVRPLNKAPIPGNSGSVKKMFNIGNNLYAHSTDTIWQMQYGRVAAATSIGAIRLGTGDLLANPEGINEGVPEGFAGLKYRNAAIQTQFGYFFVDSEARKLYRFDGKLEEISKINFDYFKNYLGFCTSTSCDDQRQSGSANYVLGVDPRLNRFLVTKMDGGGSWTMSYDLDDKLWIGWHDYIPRNYIWDRNHLYSMESGSLWRHNELNSFQILNGTYRPSIIEFSARPENAQSFQCSGIHMKTEASKWTGNSWIEDMDITFNRIALYNTTQGTGTVNLQWDSDDEGKRESMYDDIVEKGSTLRFRKQRRIWGTSEAMDFRKPDCKVEPMVLGKPCSPFTEINEAIFDCSPQNNQKYVGRSLVDTHLKYRLTFDRPDMTDINLNLIYVNTNGDEQTM